MALTTTVGTVLGLGIAALFGDTIAIIGAMVGALVGVMTGAVMTSIGSGSHKVEIIVDIYGKIIIRFNPVAGKL